MADSMRIVTYPDTFLRRCCDDVEEVDRALREAISGMARTMYANRGVGLAAPQVGIGKRIIVLNPSGDPADEKVLINPMIVDRRGAIEGEEGCLSFPGVSGLVRRHANIVVAAYDAEGDELEISASDFFARVIQHEIDHLEGMLFVDRMTPESRIEAREALKALEDAFNNQPVDVGEVH